MKKKNQTAGSGSGSGSGDMDDKDQEWDIKKIMKDIEFFSASHMTWKERKELENHKVLSLGGKPPKKQRLPLSVARVQMKKQKEREQKMLEMREQENMVLGRFGGGSGARRTVEKRKLEDRVLRSTEGHFKNGILDVKHLLSRASSRDDGSSSHMFNKGKKHSGKRRDDGSSSHMVSKGKKHSGKKNKGKKKGGGRKRH
ncbi:PREDICTED: uncharacterized protein LOC105116125 [Populus euphratica]|uniref:Uncharacterized protein LOC105116125 n=1 Tax=Populus euphratica TaxID=75702 RepID=A0AAJ6TJG5_POPEU|nr:PREDICTED: uncharacterized protein LOC105116125 [Populus euphratica]